MADANAEDNAAQGDQRPGKRRALGADAPVWAQAAVLRQRVEELRRSLEDILQALVTPSVASVVRWSDVLEKFSVLNLQYSHMVEQFKPILKQFVVYPASVGERGEMASILPIMLSSKLLPQMELEDAAISEDYDPSFQGLQIEQQPALQHLQRLQKDHEHFNAIINFLTMRKEDVANSGVFDDRGSVRENMAKNSKLISVMAAQRAEQQQGQQTQPPTRPSDRKRKRDETDVLFAAIFTGEGLRPTPPTASRAGRR